MLPGCHPGSPHRAGPSSSPFYFFLTAVAPETSPRNQGSGVEGLEPSNPTGAGERKGPGAKRGWKPGQPVSPPPQGGAWLLVLTQACVGSCRDADEAKGSGKDAEQI